MKKKLIFSCNWCKDRKTSWSGTNLAVRERLDQYYDVEDFDYGVRQPYAFAAEVLRRTLHKSLPVYSHYNKKFNKKYGKGNAVFQFAELPAEEGNTRFIYQDLTWAYVQYMEENRKDEFRFSGYQDLSHEEVARRAARQEVLYRQKDTHFLTMGKWLAKWMVEEYGISGDKVHFAGGVLT